MVLTRSEAKAAFNHVLDTVLGRGDDSLLKSALLEEGVDDIFALSTLTDKAIDKLQFKDPSNNNALTPIKLADKMLLRCFLHYVVNRSLEGNPVGDDWNAITQEKFDAFRIDPTYLSKLISMPISMSASPATAPTTPVLKPSGSLSAYTPATLFRKDTSKRDPTLFPTLKDEKLNDDWHKSFMNQARAQDVSEVLDPSYVPTTKQAKELFIEKQKYVYSVLESKVITDKGRAIVQEYKDTFDAQKVYQKLTDHHLGSTKAMVESSTIPSYITTVRLGSGEWNGSAEGFITNWNNQLQVYEHQVPPAEHFPDDQKMSMLENTVSLIAELRQVKNNAVLEKTKTGKEELTNK
jgi:hypothetical protein